MNETSVSCVNLSIFLYSCLLLAVKSIDCLKCHITNLQPYSSRHVLDNLAHTVTTMDNNGGKGCQGMAQTISNYAIGLLQLKIKKLTSVYIVLYL